MEHTFQWRLDTSSVSGLRLNPGQSHPPSSSILLHPPPPHAAAGCCCFIGEFFQISYSNFDFFFLFFSLRNSINENDERQKDTAQKFTDTLLGLMTGKIEEVRGIWKTVPAIAVKPTTLNCGFFFLFFFFFFFSSSLLLQSCKVALMTCSCSGCVLRKSLVVSRFASSLFFFSFHFFFS